MADEDYSADPRSDGNSIARQSRGGKHRGPRFTWNPAYEQTFFRSLCESVQLGLREGSTFKAEAWDRAGQALIDRHNAFPNKGHLINKSDNARKKFRLWRSLREDPDFLYNPTTKMVTANEEVWRRHIDKEPLSRSLRGRPFEHEDFYEILFPDVIGSGGAPKRIVRTRRRDTSNPNGADEQDPPGTAILDLLADAAYGNSSAPSTQQPRQTPASASASASGAAPSSSANLQQRPSSTSVPARTSVASTSALTPPDESAPHTRKRFVPPDALAQGGHEKRRRTDPLQVHPPAWAAAAGTGTAAAAAAAAATGPGSAPHDGIMALAEALKSAKARPGWSEQAVEIFFRDFGEEDMDLQLKIAEKALTDDNKAMVFCKMSLALRKHWVKRLREVHNRSA